MACSSSSSSSLWKYDVFLSFRGIDTRKSFIGFLYKELDRKDINTFKDDEKLEKGSTISPELIQAIEDSRFAIVVVSENYASSSWCLEELAKIMECEKKKSLTVIPIFYGVDPSDVRWQKGKFAEHFKKHEKRENREKVKRWRDALTKLANKSGMDSRDWGDNAELIDEITKDILNGLNFAASSDLTYLVGMDVHMEAMNRLLDLESNNEVCLIGIWGMGGVGKTTLARYVYENIVKNFQTCCFLEDVKKIYHDHGASGLQGELMSRIQGEDRRKSYLGSNVINERLGRRKVLLVVDDVNDVKQLDALAKEEWWFGPGSRVIVTTRDRHLLDSCGIKHVYEAKCLAFNKALQLFCQSAFEQKHPPNDFQSLSKRAVRIAAGLPLALRVFGSFLCGRDKGFWEDAFDELETSLDEKVMNILKISYDGLRKGHKHIFLYVACFFDGKGHVSDVEDVLDKGVRSGIQVLVEKCLISISEFGDITMHDLVKQMGRELMSQESLHDPRKCIMLWKRDEIYRILRSKREHETVEAISLDMDEGDKLIFGEKTFEKVPNLKFLRIRSNSIGGETKLQHGQCNRINFPDQLRYLDWLQCPSSILQFCGNNLVKLKLWESKLEKLWEGSPCLENLKEIDVSSSYNLKEFPDLSKAPNLEVITALGCRSLKEIPPSICSLDKLRELDLRECEGLQRLPNNMDMKSLEDVRLHHCRRIKMYPKSCRGVKFLFLDLKRVSELPESIGRLSYLEVLALQSCKWLKHLPETIGDLISLKFLELVNCPMLQSIPESIGRLTNLEELVLSKCERLKHLPDTIGDLISLESLKLVNCRMLHSIPESIGRLTNLVELLLSKCERLKHLPNTIGICGTGNYFEEREAEEIGMRTLLLPNHEELIISRAEKSDGSSSYCLPSSNFPSLTRLHLINLSMLKISGDLDRLTSLKELDLSGNDFGMIPASIKWPTKLSKLKIDDCVNLYSLPELPPNIEVLSAYGCTALAEVSEVSKLKFTKRTLIFANCFKLKEEIRFFSKLMISTIGDKALVVLPGSEVPSCFDHRNKGSSLTVSLPSGSPSVELVGFVACIVVLDHLNDVDLVEWQCQYTRENCSTSFCRGSLCYEARVPSGHILILNGYLRLEEEKDEVFDQIEEDENEGFDQIEEDEDEVFDQIEEDENEGFDQIEEDEDEVFDQISFEFSFRRARRRNPYIRLPLTKIKECGVCLQYTPSSSSSSATCDANGTSGPSEPLEAENNAIDHQADEVTEPSPSTKKQISFRVFRVVLFLFLFSFLLSLFYLFYC